jgi:hypothetical protein
MPDIDDLTYFQVVRTVSPVPGGVLTAEVVFEAQVTKGLALQADISPDVLEILVRPVKARIVDGVLMKDGAASVSLLSAAEVAIDGGFSYLATFKNARVDGTEIRDGLKALTFAALDTAGTFDLKDAAPIVSSTAIPTARGPQGFPVDDVQGVDGDTAIQFSVQGEPIGDPLVLPSAAWGSILGRPVVVAGGADAAAARDSINAVDDFDFRLDDTRTPIDGSVTAAKLHSSLTQLGNITGANFVVSLTAVLNADSATNSATKATAFGLKHYTNAEEPLYGMSLFSDSTTNIVRFGGGNSAANAATQLEFYTAANNTTTTGTLRTTIASDGTLRHRGTFTTQPTTGVASMGMYSPDNQAALSLSTAAAQFRTVSFNSVVSGNFLTRWNWRVNNVAEAGSDVGAEMELQSRADDGTAKLTVFNITRAGLVTWGAGVNFTFNTTTGTKLGTGSTQKMGFWGATPVVQPTAVVDATDAATVITQLNSLLAKMRTIGLVAP